MTIETLRPNAAGDETDIESPFPDAGEAHWEDVDDVVADDGTTHVVETRNVFHRDLYNLSTSTDSDQISKITIFFRCGASLFTSDAKAKVSIKSNGVVTDGDEETPPVGSWQSFSSEFVTNPADSLPWKRADIDALQIGISLKSGTSASTPKSNCTQVYVEVESHPRPVITTRIAFDSDAFTATPVWTDVSSDVISVRTVKGRKNVLDRMESGIAEVVLKNTSGDYWPDNSGGSNFPNVKTTKRINIRATFSGTTRDLFTGFITKWLPSWRAQTGTGGPIMTVLAADLIKNLSRFAMNNAGFAEELSGTRVDNVLDELGWPSGDRDIDAGQTTLQATGAISNLRGQSHLFKVQETEAGIVFIAGDGDVQFQDRAARFKSPFDTSQATFDAAAGNQLYMDAELSLDDDLLFTEVRITRTGGTEQVASSETAGDGWSIGTAGKSELGITTILAFEVGKRTLILSDLLMTTDAVAKDLADYYLSIFEDAILRAKSITIFPDRDPSNLYPDILAFDIGTRITLVLSQASINKDYHIEGITHTYRARELRWRTTWQLSDADNRAFWTLGTTNLSELGETTKLFF